MAVGSWRQVAPLRLDFGCALLAGIGVVVPTNPGLERRRRRNISRPDRRDRVGLLHPSTDLLGRSCQDWREPRWRAASQPWWIPVAAWWFTTHEVTITALGLAATCGVLLDRSLRRRSSALRYVPAHVRDLYQRQSRVGCKVRATGQILEVNEWVGIVLIVASNAVVVWRSRAR